MKISALPVFLQIPYRKLKKEDVHKKEKSNLIHLIFSHTISLLAKLALLEYLQGNWKSNSITYLIFRGSYPNDPHLWLERFQDIMHYFSVHEIIPVLPPILNIWEKYSTLRKQMENDDRIARLLWFYDLFLNDEYIIADDDIEECEEQITVFLEDMAFLETLRYEIRDRRTRLVFNGKSLELYPFYVAQGEGENVSLDIFEDGPHVLEKSYELWMPNEWKKYQRESRGEIDFNDLNIHRPKYILPPWLQISIEEALQKTFIAIQEIQGDNILSIEGYPGTGKTAFVTNLSNWLSDVDQIFCYYILQDSPLEESAAFEKWLMSKLNDFLQLSNKNDETPDEDRNPQEELLHWWLNCQDAFVKLAPKIVVAIDGLEHMPLSQYKRLRRFLQQSPLNTIAFLLVKRSYESPVLSFCHTIQLGCEDNLFFEETFTTEYIQNLKQRYLADALAMEVFTILAHNTHRYLTPIEIAEAIGTFTPKALKVLMKIKPLCQVRPVDGQIPMEQYRLFHPICQKLL